MVEKVHTVEIESKELAISVMEKAFSKGTIRLARVETMDGKHIRDKFRNNP